MADRNDIWDELVVKRYERLMDLETQGLPFGGDLTQIRSAGEDACVQTAQGGYRGSIKVSNNLGLK